MICSRSRGELCPSAHKNEIDYLRHTQEDIIYRTSDIIGVSFCPQEGPEDGENVAKPTPHPITGETVSARGSSPVAIHHNSAGPPHSCRSTAPRFPRTYRRASSSDTKGRLHRCCPHEDRRVERLIWDIFLDEIVDHDTPAVEILRVLEDRDSRGSRERTIKVDVRVITATNQT
jgi:hypothetical protein